LVEACALTAERFAHKCLTGLGAGAGESFRGTVILSPEAVAEFLLPNLITSLCADTVRKGQSPLAAKLGGRIAVEAFSLIDDGRLPGGIASSAFDRDGLPTGRNVLVDAGLLNTFLWNYYEACAAGARSTGNASGGVGTLPGVGPNHLEVAAGDSAESDLIGGAERAVIVNRFSGSTNPVTGDFSGVVKNGFLVAAGSARPIKETMIAGNLYTLLENITEVSRERRHLNGTVLVPSLRVERISVTAG
jgi:PmbA protein